MIPANKPNRRYHFHPFKAPMAAFVCLTNRFWGFRFPKTVHFVYRTDLFMATLLCSIRYSFCFYHLNVDGRDGFFQLVSAAAELLYLLVGQVVLNFSTDPVAVHDAQHTHTKS